MSAGERKIISQSYAPMFARYWQIEKAIRMRVGEFKPTHKLTIENLKYHTSEESVYMEVTFLDAGRLPSGADWTGCMRYYYSYVDWIAYNKPSFGVDAKGDICNFIGLLLHQQMGSPDEKNVIAMRLDELNEDDEDGDRDEDSPGNYDDDDDDDDDEDDRWSIDYPPEDWQ